MATPEYGPIIICAAGEGSRIRPMMDEMGYPDDYPKPLLPTGNLDGETLLGRIVRQAMIAPVEQPPIVYATPEGRAYMEAHHDIGEVVYDHTRFARGGGLDPYYYRLKESRHTVIGCAGDFYSGFTWEEFLGQHEEAGLPVSVLAGQTHATDHAAIFEVADGLVLEFRRPEKSRPNEYRNVGVYAFDPHPDVLGIMDEMLPDNREDFPSSDAVFLRLVKEGLVGAITEIGGRHFNVNTEQDYAALQGYHQTRPNDIAS